MTSLRRLLAVAVATVAVIAVPYGCALLLGNTATRHEPLFDYLGLACIGGGIATFLAVVVRWPKLSTPQVSKESDR